MNGKMNFSAVGWENKEESERTVREASTLRAQNGPSPGWVGVSAVREDLITVGSRMSDCPDLGRNV